MKSLRKHLDKIKPQFMKGGRFEKLHSTFDAFETFLFVPDKVTFKGSHIRDSIDLKRTMSTVIVALLPALLFGIYNVGYQHYISYGEHPGFWQIVGYGLQKVLPLIVVSYGVGLGIEFIFAQYRGHEVNEGYLVTGMLIPLILPPDIPLWIVALSVAFAVIFGKEVFGGTGMNVLNPALLARGFLFFAYPAAMTGDKVWIAGKADAYSGETVLGHAMIGNSDQINDPMGMFIGLEPGSIGETSVIAILIGAAILLFTGIASWRIMLATMLGATALGLLVNAIGANEYMRLPFYFHFLMGGFAFGLVFMATDPVTSAQTNRGKWIYGVLLGALIIIIRVFNPAYPEGVMLAILLMNVFAPLIDHYVIQANIRYRVKRAKAARVHIVK
ncbi:MAG: NADH:ubiquinone reductase (Na(+)-transporting) subunit B [Bacteroidales bacterium]|nr:NADH:ubiquinone reductase (Na(+)-transporting) subunit B [Bacteroidales bacterium]